MIIVSKHQATIEWLKKKGFDGQVISHVDNPEIIKDQTVVGNLPFHLAVLAKEVGIVDIPNLPKELRGTDLTLEQLEEFGATLNWYVVRKK